MTALNGTVYGIQGPSANRYGERRGLSGGSGVITRVHCVTLMQSIESMQSSCNRCVHVCSA